MTRAYSIDLREGVVRQVEAGGSVRRVAAMFAVSPSFVVKLAQAWRQRGTVAARPQGGDRRSTALERHRDWQLVAETPDLTLAEIRDRLGEHGTPASISAIWRLFDRHGISFKKKPPTPPNRCARTRTPRVSGWRASQDGLNPRPGSSSSTRPGPPPTWPECAAAVSAARAWSAPSRTTIGRSPPWLPDCATTVLPHPLSSTAQ